MIIPTTTLHGCVIEDESVIGIGAIVLNHARIGKGAVVAAGSLVPEGMQVPPGTLVMGVPAKPRRAVTEEEAMRRLLSIETVIGIRAIAFLAVIVGCTVELRQFWMPLPSMFIGSDRRAGDAGHDG